jgi:serine/threonine protein phosphatase PrpC
MNDQTTQQESIHTIFAKGTDVGRKRDHNEDYVDAFVPPDAAQRRQKGDLYILADGMGGHQAGEVASEGAVRVISHEYYNDPDPDIPAALTRAIKKANAVIHQKAKENVHQAGMGTTAVVAVVRGRELHVANVGDSRAYLLRNGQLTQITRDHSFVEDQVRAGVLTREEARAHPQRNVITRALGSKPDVQVDTFRGTLQAGDRLLLCSDGLSEHVEDEEMANALRQHTPEEAIPQLIALANERGGNDNISVLVAQAVSDAADTVPIAQPTVPLEQPPTRPPRNGLPVPLLAGLGFGGLIILAGLVAAGVFFVPKIISPPAPTATATATVTPSPTPTATPTPEPTATPRATPKPEIEILGPADGEAFSPGEVSFQWNVSGSVPSPFIGVVQTLEGELCRINQLSCTVTLTTTGDYEWWIVFQGPGGVEIESDHRVLHIREPTPSPTTRPPTEAATEAPATETPTTKTPESTGG